MARYIELTVNWVVRDDDGDMNAGQSRNMGILRWDADNPGLPPTELSSLDAMTIELMRVYVEMHDERLSAWKNKVAQAKKLATPAGDRTDLSHAMKPIEG